MISEQTQRELDYWTLIYGNAKEGIGAPEHDCPLVGGHGEKGCRVCADYWEARRWWLEQKKNENKSRSNN